MEEQKTLQEREEELTDEQARVLWVVRKNIGTGLHIRDFIEILFHDGEYQLFEELRKQGLVIINENGTVYDWQTNEQANEFRYFHQRRATRNTHWFPRSRHYGPIEEITEEQSANLDKVWPENPLLG